MSKQHLTKLQVSDRFFTPDVIGRNGMSVYDCLSEFIANSFDWCITKKYPDIKTIIQILINPKSIEIVDNGVGMNLKELSSAINIAESSDLIRNKINEFEERKGMYGMGMKVSALSLGWKFTITTISIEDPNTELVFEFDSQKLMNDEGYTRDTLITEEYEKRVDSPLKEFKSGTHVKIENLVKRLPDINAVQEDLRERFSPDINLLLQDDLLDFSVSDSYGSKNTIGKFNVNYNFEDDVLKLDFENPHQWAKEKSYIYTGSNGKKFQLRGYLQLLKQRSFQGNFGLNLYCKGQLIERYHKNVKGLFSTAGRAAEKTYGELHLDGLNPDYVKSKGFIEDNAFKEVANLIAKDLEVYKFLGIASSVAAERIKLEINKRKGIGGVEEPEFEEDEEEELIDGEEGEDIENPAITSEEEDDKKNIITIDKKLKIEICAPYVNLNGLDPKNKLSRECFYSKSRVDNNLWIIQVYLNPESALFKSFENLYNNYSDKNKAITLLKKITICESIFDKLISEHKYKEDLARKITDLKVYPKVLKLNLN